MNYIALVLTGIGIGYFIAGLVFGMMADHYFHMTQGDFKKGRGNYPKSQDK